ncbi:fibrous sheath CABYR-binding protein isoform X4 [Chelmon rostratus]|uniref:fibrous sheath CABYR-binding protein isoform X4 n=1 Tax=Chelmon rostratus TaxID=109905 RepID=UPI001BE9BED7|nr:fibrous sheath CABYR-binding protein isoform X4 [Chelmon rostratus]
MFCRRAWQRLGPLARRAFNPASRNAAPVRHMAFGVPGGSSNTAYLVLCGGGLTAAAVYAYKTVNGDSERHEDRLASMGSTEKAPEAMAPEATATATATATAAAPELTVAAPEEVEAPEAAAAAAESTTVEEVAPAAEVVAESVPAPAEPVAETAAEPVAEAASEEAAVASEVVVAETAAEPAVEEEAAPPVAVEAVPEAAPVTVEVAAMEDTPAEAPVAESAESMPDLLTAVKILAGSTVEIAAASVGETSLVKAVRKVEEDGKVLDATLEVAEPEVLEATAEVVGEEAAVVVNMEELKSTEAGADAEDADVPAAEEETSAPVAAAAEEEEEEAALPEEPTTSAPTAEEGGEVEAENQALAPAAAPEAVSSAEASPEDAAPAEEATPDEEAPIAAETAPAAEASVEEEAAAEAAAEETVEAAAVVDTIQLAAASGSELEVHEAKHCHSCHSAPSAAEEVAPPVALGGQLASEEALDITHEAKEAVSLVEGQKPKMSIWTVKSCSVM